MELRLGIIGSGDARVFVAKPIEPNRQTAIDCDADHDSFLACKLRRNPQCIVVRDGG